MSEYDCPYGCSDKIRDAEARAEQAELERDVARQVVADMREALSERAHLIADNARLRAAVEEMEKSRQMWRDLSTAQDAENVHLCDVVKAATRVVWFDWSTNDADASEAIDALRAALARAAAETEGMKTEITITAVWLRRIGDHAQVLCEIDGKWRLAIQEHAEGSYSHIAEGRGAADWPLDDDVTEARTDG